MDKNLIPSARRVAGAEGHRQRASRFEQVAEKRQACDVAKNDTNPQKLVKKSLEIQVEEKQVAEINNKVRTVKNSLEVTNSSIKLTPR